MATSGWKHKDSNCLLLHYDWEVIGQMAEKHTDVPLQWVCKEIKLI